MWRIRIELTNTCATNKRLTILPYVTIIKWCSWWLQRFSPSLTSDAPHPNYIVAIYLPNSEDGILPPSALGDIPMPINGFEPLTLWLQIRCSANWAKSAKCSWYVVAQDISLTPDPKRDQTTLFEKGDLVPKKLLRYWGYWAFTSVIYFLGFLLRGQGVEKTDRCQTCALHPPSSNVHSTRIYRLSLLTSSGYWSILLPTFRVC